MSDRRYYSSKPIIQYDRDSSTSSYGSRSSTEAYHPSSRSTMTNGYYSGTQHYSSRDEPSERRYRTADDDRKYVSGKVNTSGKREVEVIDQRRVIYDREEPRASNATASEYKESRKHKHSHREKSSRHS